MHPAQPPSAPSAQPRNWRDDLGALWLMIEGVLLLSLRLLLSLTLLLIPLVAFLVQLFWVLSAQRRLRLFLAQLLTPLRGDPLASVWLRLSWREIETPEAPLSPPGPTRPALQNASLDMLLAVEGLGERRARELLLYQERFGPFRHRDELRLVEGVGPQTISLLERYFTLPPAWASESEVEKVTSSER